MLIAAGIIFPVALIVGVIALTQAPPRVTVYAINALDLPVVVSIADVEPVTLDAGKWLKVDVPPGQFDVAATIDGREFERAAVTTFDDGLVVWSIAGAAPLMLDASHDQPRLLAGTDGPLIESFPRATRVQFDPTHRGTLPGLMMANDVHWRTTLGLFLEAHEVQGGARLTLGVWRAMPDRRDTIDAALQLTSLAGGSDAVQAFGRELIASGHADEKARFMLQEVAMRSMSPEQVRKAAREEAAAAPDSPLAQLLLARAERQAKALELHAELQRRFPDYHWRCRDYAWRLLVAGLHDAAANEYALYETVDPADSMWFVRWRVTALLGADRVAEALKLVAATAQQAIALRAPVLDAAVLSALLSQRVPDSGIRDPRELMTRMFGTPDRHPFEWAQFRIRTGTDSPGEFDTWDDNDFRTALRLMQAARRVPGTAAALAGRASPSVFRLINDDATLLVLAGEAAAANNPTTAGQLLLAIDAIDSEQRTALGAFVVGGVETDLLDELAPDMQAALALLRGLRCKADDEGRAARAKWLRRAIELDVPDGVAQAIARRELGSD